MNWFLSPNVLLAAIIAIGTIGLSAYHITKVSGARTEGIAVGTGTASTAALESAKKTAEAEREAEAETPVDADLAYYRKLCGQSASCRSRSKYK